jgi:hypothetical protein
MNTNQYHYLNYEYDAIDSAVVSIENYVLDYQNSLQLIQYVMVKEWLDVVHRYRLLIFRFQL